jgi:hypothetical protein
MIDKPARDVHPEATMKLERWGAPAALVVVVALVAGFAVWLAGGIGGGSSADPPLLRLMSASDGSRDAAMSAADSTEPASSGAAYKLVGTLPDGTPADQAIYRLADATADDVTTVARAFGMSGEPQRIDGGWALSDNGNRLWVREDGSWSYGPDCGDVTEEKGVEYMCAYAVDGGTAVAVAPPPDEPVSSEPDSGTADDPVTDEPGTDDGGNVSSRDEDATCNPDGTECSVPGSSGSGSGSGSSTGTTPDCPPDTKECAVDDPAPEPLPAPEVEPGPSEADARAAADKIFTALGLSDARVTVWPGNPTASVSAAPRVNGMDTIGLGTYLQVDGDGNVTWADGRLPGVVAGASYPVISAQAAFDKLLDQPRVAMDICMVREDGKDGCAEIPPSEVTGGALGLLLDYDAERPVLVPAWLFDIKGQPEPVAQIAIDPSFLAPPPGVDDGSVDGDDPKPLPPDVEPMPVDGGDGTGSSGGGSDGSTGDPGVVEPAEAPAS